MQCLIKLTMVLMCCCILWGCQTTPNPIDSKAQEISFPAWATEQGVDDIGPWCKLVINDTSMRFRYIPSKTFLMGKNGLEDSGTGHKIEEKEVTVSRGFWLAETECTEAFWYAVQLKTISDSSASESQIAKHNVTWHEVIDFMTQLRVHTGNIGFRLPTEAEWESATVHDDTASSYEELDLIAWHRINTFDQGSPQAVAQKAPNAYGLYDMIGNLGEWCMDSYLPQRSYAETDPIVTPSNSPSSKGRVYKGGTWKQVGIDAYHPANRTYCSPKWAGDYVGFRIIWQQPSP